MPIQQNSSKPRTLYTIGNENINKLQYFSVITNITFFYVQNKKTEQYHIKHPKNIPRIFSISETYAESINETKDCNQQISFPNPLHYSNTKIKYPQFIPPRLGMNSGTNKQNNQNLCLLLINFSL